MTSWGTRARAASARAACALAPIAALALAGCSPSAFDALVGSDGGARDASAAGEGRSDAGDESARDAGPNPGMDAASSDAAMDAGLVDGASGTGDGAAPMPDAAPTGCTPASDPDTVRARAIDLGAIEIPGDQLRVGPTARIGARMLWTFWAADGAFAIWTDAGDEPLTAPPVLEAPQPPVALLPGDAVPAGLTAAVSGLVVTDGEALVYFLSGYAFTPGETGLAKLAIDAQTAELIHAAGELFPQPEPDAGAPMPWFPRFHTGTLAHTEPDGVYVYLYACNPDPDAPGEQPGGLNQDPCRVARVRIEEAQDGSAYRYWNGRGWVGDAGSARVVINHVPGGLSVSYNRYLEKFLAVHSQGASNQVTLRWADRPEGPWHPLDQFETMPATGAFGFTIDAAEQPALRDPCHRTLYVTYSLPLAADPPGGADVFEPRLVRVALE